MRSTISFGVDAGAITAIQAMFSISGSPASFIVGISGVSALRLAVETASGRSLPALTCGITATAGTQANCTSPCSSARIASGDEAYGMCTAKVSVLALSSSTPSCDRLPTPVEEKLNLPGLAFIALTSSPRLVMPESLRTAQTLAWAPPSTTGRSSVNGS